MNNENLSSNGQSNAVSTDSDLLPIILSIWRRRKLVIIITAVFTVFALTISLILPPIYTARVSILPQPQNKNTEVLGKLASFTGASLGMETSYEQLYSEIVKSDRILDAVLKSQWKSYMSPDSIAMFDILDVSYSPEKSREMRLAEFKAKRKLREKIISMTRDKVTGYVVLKVNIERDPDLAADLANFLVDRLDVYLRNFHSHKAQRQREFIEDRLATVSKELKTAEAELSQFLENNRSYTSSPALMQRYAELEREVTAQTSIWVELRRQRETARIDEHKNLVSIDVLDRATPPVKRSRPQRGTMTIGGMILGLFTAIIFVLILDQFRSLKSNI